MISKAVSSTIFWVFGMTWPGFEPWSLSKIPGKYTFFGMKPNMFNTMKNKVVYTLAKCHSLIFKLAYGTSLRMCYHLKLQAFNSGNAISCKTMKPSFFMILCFYLVNTYIGHKTTTLSHCLTNHLSDTPVIK